MSVFVEMRFKQDLGCWRPVHYSHQVQPMITTPGHGSLPMGHATQAYMTAYILYQLADPARTAPLLEALYYRQAFRMAFNRIVAGVHFPVDLPAGAALGMALGEYFISRCTDLSVVNPPPYGQQKAAALTVWDFTLAAYAANPITNPNFLAAHRTAVPLNASCPFAPTVSYLWTEALKEWKKP
jgi:hypothetical protein